MTRRTATRPQTTFARVRVFASVFIAASLCIAAVCLNDHYRPRGRGVGEGEYKNSAMSLSRKQTLAGRSPQQAAEVAVVARQHGRLGVRVCASVNSLSV